MKDEQIVSLYWDRNEDAVVHTQRKYGVYLWKISHNILSDGEDSHECVNDTYLKAWNSIPPHRPSILSTYLGRITRQLSIDVFRRKRSAKRLPSEYALSLEELGDTFFRGSTPEQELDAKVLRDTVEQFVRGLSEDARNVFVGRYYFFDSVSEVARYCGMSESGVKSLLYRTRQNLKDHLAKEGFAV